jgi:hypothetical protein
MKEENNNYVSINNRKQVAFNLISNVFSMNLLCNELKENVLYCMTLYNGEDIL